ncbi:MAG: hypothetical protein ACTS73_08835 [Arsenophonus sp. NEOnobi-MAG3]
MLIESQKRIWLKFSMPCKRVSNRILKRLLLARELVPLVFGMQSKRYCSRHAAPTLLRHKTANDLASLSKGMQTKVNAELREKRYLWAGEQKAVILLIKALIFYWQGFQRTILQLLRSWRKIKKN